MKNVSIFNIQVVHMKFVSFALREYFVDVRTLDVWMLVTLKSKIAHYVRKDKLYLLLQTTFCCKKDISVCGCFK